MNEEKLFSLLKDKLISDLEYSEHSMSRYDCFSVLYNTDIELKCRKTHYDDLVIEKTKYDALIERAEIFSTRAVYINHTPEGLWSFRLLELPEPIWQSKHMPTTTEFSNKSFILKVVGFIPVSSGIDLSRIL